MISSHSTRNEYYDVWSISFLIDKLKQCLAMNSQIINNQPYEQIIEYRKYYYQVLQMQKIGYLDPRKIKPFEIDLTDLPEKMKIELLDMNELNRGYVLCQAVGRLFEDVNAELYHNSISRLLKVRLEK